MTRLIDADEIIKRSHDVIIGNGTKHRCFDTTLIHEIPTVDAVRVIRCKDCKYAVDEYDDGKCYCANDRTDLLYIGDDWNHYCGWAERKEE